MAALLRRWRGLLVLTLMVATGFMIFLTKWKSRSIKNTEQGLSVQTRKDSNLTSQGSRASQETVLKRLSFLEEVVYRQLNGLSKSLGLIEGYEGRGKGGLAATLSPDEQVKAKDLGEKYGYNAYLSQKISLDRSLPDFRPSKCKELTYRKDLPQISLIFIFVNEALSVILRSVHSAVNHTPAHLLKEIILVDDDSDDGLNQFCRELKRIENALFFPPLITSNRTRSSWCGMKTLATATPGSCGACTSAPPRSGGTRGMFLHQSGWFNKNMLHLEYITYLNDYTFHTECP